VDDIRQGIKSKGEKMREKLKALYLLAPDEAIDEMIRTAAKYDLEPDTVQMIMYESETRGAWVSKISRHGYRKIAQRQPGYQGHHYTTLYKGDKVAIKDNDILIEMASESRTYNDLLGAVAWLFNGGVLHFVRLSYSDYCRQKYGWDQSTGRPDFMMQKEAEVMVIRKAYSALFLDDPAREFDAEEDDPIGTRLNVLTYIKENMRYITSPPKYGLEKCTPKELEALVAQIIKNKEDTNDQ